MTIARILFVTSAALTAAACMEPLEPASLIERPRVLGARVEVAGDLARAWPRPGETAQVSWIIATPDGAPAELAWQLAACPTAGSCDTPLAASSGRGAAPTLSVPVPTDAVAGEEAITLIGTIDDGERRTDVVAHLGVAAVDANHNPDLTDDAFTVDAATWPEGGDCGDGVTPRVSVGQPVEVGWRPVGDDRELDGDALETLQLSSFASGGTIRAQFAFVEGDGGAVTVAWTAPETVAGPTPVNFTFVVRDLRGGLDATTRVLCVTP